MNLASKLFLIALLPMAAAVTSCQDDNEWKPTWALPIIKEQTIRIGEFIGHDHVAKVNEKVKEEWKNYVEEQSEEEGGDLAAVDSVAYRVLTDSSSTYVAFDSSGAPKLSESTEAQIRENLNEDSAAVEEKINQINKFLAAYYAAQHDELGTPPAQASNLKAKARPRAEPAAGSESASGEGGSAISTLLDAIIDQNNVFVTAANLLSTLGDDYIDSINNRIDDILEQANMVDSVELDLEEYVGEGVSITALELYLNITDSLPFDVNLNINFVGAKGDSISNIVNRSNFETTISKVLKEDKDRAELDNIIQNAKKVKFSVACRRTDPITGEILRSLSDKGITFSLRVKVQAPMNNFNF
ncbi:MAG: hypothetical protein LBG47_02480 [Prevotellaceae bacterium]|jgi:hypothetical protein|nr:hypothetical protein [Prevotellaceae bacterium]